MNQRGNDPMEFPVDANKVLDQMAVELGQARKDCVVLAAQRDAAVAHARELAERLQGYENKPKAPLNPGEAQEPLSPALGADLSV